MGVDIEMLVIIPTVHRADLAELAKKFPRPAPPTGTTPHAVQTFLDALSALGDEHIAAEPLVTHASPHNRVWPPSFVEDLKDFWTSLYYVKTSWPSISIGPDGGRILSRGSSVLVMWREDEALATKVIEISRLPTGEGIRFTTHEVPFFWTYP
jgi:hypothetical protein